MLSLPGTPLQHTSFVGESPIAMKLALRQPRGLSTVYVSELTDYVDLIFSTCSADSIDPWTCQDRISSSCPWKHVKKADGWLLKDELVMSIAQLALGFITRACELGDENWANTVKLLKRALAYLAYIQVDSTVWECGNQSRVVYYSIGSCGIQLGVLSQKLALVKSRDFDLFNSDLNAASLSRIAIWVKDELEKSLRTLQQAQFKLKDPWISYLEDCLRYVKGLTGLLLSLDSYKQDKVGESLGWLSYGLDFIQSHGDRYDNKLKSKLIGMKNKIGKRSLKLDMDLYKQLSSPLQRDLNVVFEFCQVLDVKYSKENNYMSYDQIVKRDVLVGKMPLGRPVPVDVTPWSPFTQDVQQTGYF